MNYWVELTERAYDDLDRLTAHLVKNRSDDAGRLTTQFSRALSRPETLPLSCGLAYESRYFNVEIRHLLFEVRKGRSYRALFTVESDCVRILAVRAPGERPLKPRDVGL